MARDHRSLWVLSGICGCMSSSSASHHEDGADGWERNTTLSGRWYLSPASHEQHPVPTDGDHGCESLSSGGRNGVSGRPVPVSVPRRGGAERSTCHFSSQTPRGANPTARWTVTVAPRWPCADVGATLTTLGAVGFAPGRKSRLAGQG